MNYENERILNEMEAEIDALNEAKTAIEKARKSIEKAGSMCNLLHLADEADMSNLAQKYEVEILKRKRILAAVNTLEEMDVEIGSLFPFSKDSKAVFSLEGMHIVLHMLLKQQEWDDKDFDYIIRHVIKVVTAGSAVNFEEFDSIENCTCEELESLVAFLTGRLEFAKLQAETAKHVDGVLSII